MAKKKRSTGLTDVSTSPPLENQIFIGFNVGIDKIYWRIRIYGWKAKMDRIS
jgi:hypothetical protein